MPDYESIMTETLEESYRKALRNAAGPWQPGDRVVVDYEGPGTVVADFGWLDLAGPPPRVNADAGVVVTVDSDGETVSCAHAQLAPLRVGMFGRPYADCGNCGHSLHWLPIGSTGEDLNGWHHTKLPDVTTCPCISNGRDCHAV